MQNETEFDTGSRRRSSPGAMAWTLDGETGTAAWSIPVPAPSTRTASPGRRSPARPKESLIDLLAIERRTARLENVVWFALATAAAAETILVLLRLTSP